MSNLIGRRGVCADRVLQERVEQAMAECGKVAPLAQVVAGLVASVDHGEGRALDAKLVSDDMSDEEIIAYVNGLP
ncbi:MAG: hypothetical protein B7Z62_00315 [Deltaproteobacteria bacterium 37-65-8]|nr:MAG: hypothetical protein B7Z62_00315 [Deltaproteobacteria bacterium 37-65-8]